MSKVLKTVAALGCFALAVGLSLSGEEQQLRLTNNTERAQKVEITRGKDSTCQANALFDVVQIAAGGEIDVPFAGHAYVCWRVDGGGANGELTAWRSISCGLEKPTCSAVLFQ
jgi:hypothetical protein